MYLWDNEWMAFLSISHGAKTMWIWMSEPSYLVNLTLGITFMSWIVSQFVDKNWNNVNLFTIQCLDMIKKGLANFMLLFISLTTRWSVRSINYPKVLKIKLHLCLFILPKKCFMQWQTLLYHLCKGKHWSIFVQNISHEQFLRENKSGHKVINSIFCATS